MYFKNYKYFLAIVEYGGVTRAAEALFLSQPSLSKYLRRLEQNLGIELFDHSSSPLKLTYAGQRYYEYIKRFESLERQFDDELGSIRVRLRRNPHGNRAVARLHPAAHTDPALPRGLPPC